MSQARAQTRWTPREEVSSSLFVARCDGAKVLDDVEETVDEVALAKSAKSHSRRRLAICPWRNDGLDAADFGKRLTNVRREKGRAIQWEEDIPPGNCCSSRKQSERGGLVTVRHGASDAEGPGRPDQRALRP